MYAYLSMFLELHWTGYRSVMISMGKLQVIKAAFPCLYLPTVLMWLLVHLETKPLDLKRVTREYMNTSLVSIIGYKEGQILTVRRLAIKVDTLYLCRMTVVVWL